MDEVELFFRQLVKVLSESSPERLNAPIQISELYQSILPYRHYRSALAVDTMDDYDIVLLRMLAGEGGFVTIDPPEVQGHLETEVASVNPNPGAFRDYAAANIYLNSGAVRTVTEAGDDYAPPGDDEADNFSVHSVSGSDVEFITEDAPTTPTPSLSLEPQSFDATATATAPTPPAYKPPPEYELPTAYEPPPREHITPFEGTPPVLPPMLSRSQSPLTKPTERCESCHGALPTNREVSFCPHCGKRFSQLECTSCGAELEETWKFCVECGAGSDS